MDTVEITNLQLVGYRGGQEWRRFAFRVESAVSADIIGFCETIIESGIALNSGWLDCEWVAEFHDPVTGVDEEVALTCKAQMEADIAEKGEQDWEGLLRGDAGQS